MFVKFIPFSHSQLLGCMSFGIKNITEKQSVSENVLLLSNSKSESIISGSLPHSNLSNV